VFIESLGELCAGLLGAFAPGADDGVRATEGEGLNA